MSKSIISLLVGGVALLAILLVGCSDEPSPTPSAEAEWHLLHIEAYRAAQAGVDTQPKDDVMVDNPTMNAVGDDFVEKSREAAARVPRDVRQQMPEPTPLSLDEYLTLCATTEQELADDATFGDLSSLIAADADRLEALTPPAQLSEWPLLNIEGFLTIQAFVDSQPKNDVIDFGSFLIMAAASADSEEKLSEAAARLPEDVRQQMIEAGCIDPEDVPDDREDATDDHGNDIDDATAIRVGADVRGALDYDGDIDFFRFQAERGQSYQIDVAPGTLDDSIVSLFDSDGWLDTNDDYGDTLASRLYWNASSSGERYVAVEGYGLGSNTLTVSLIVDDHGNSEGDATAIRVGTEVRGAVDYDDDIDFFRFQAERGQRYQIDVALGTLDDSIVELYDVDWSFLDSNDDYETFASRLYWEAPSSGERYVAVYGYGVGTYTLTVALVDDHGDTAEDGGSVASDRAVLVALYNATEGGSWTTRTNWLSGRPLDEWHGVTTDSGGRVTALNLSSNSLYGALPAALGDLTNLESLRLSDNPLRGPIPAALGDLSNLRELNLGSEGRGRLTGPIPATLGDLTNLESLVLSSNELTGPIPAWLGDLSNLVELSLWSNELTGPIPAALGDLTNLESLRLGWNELTGPIPAALGDLSNLVELALPVGQLTGPIPAELGDLSNLQWLDLSFNYLTGPIPAALGDLANLEYLDLGGGNHLTGRIPADLGDLSNLKFLDLWGNELTGPIPAELSNLSNLEFLELAFNELTGPIPAALSNLSNLSELYLSGNQLTGDIPTELGSLSNLQGLYL